MVLVAQIAMYGRLTLLFLALTAGALAQQMAPAEGPTSIPSLAPLLAPSNGPAAGAAVAALASFPSLAVPSSAPPTETLVEAPAPTASAGLLSKSFSSMADHLQLLLKWPHQFRRCNMIVFWVSNICLQTQQEGMLACNTPRLWPQKNMGCIFNNPTLIRARAQLTLALFR